MDVEDIDDGPLPEDEEHEEEEEEDEYSDDLEGLTDSEDSEDMWPLELASDEEEFLTTQDAVR